MAQMNVTATETYAGAYDNRTAAVYENTAGAEISAGTKGDSDKVPSVAASIEISEESKTFMEGVAERKAAQRAAREATAKNQPVNAFSYVGDFMPTYEVFSQNLRVGGFYQGKTDEEIRKTESLLKDITDGMHSISDPASLRRNYNTELSHEAARLELVSSVNALQFFADQYLSGGVKDSFLSLIEEYHESFGARVSVHRNSFDDYDEAMSHLGAPNATGNSAATDKVKAAQMLGRVTHTAKEEEKNRTEMQALFEKLKNREDSTATIFAGLQRAFLSFASGGNANSSVTALLMSRNQPALNGMQAYWEKLLR